MCDVLHVHQPDFDTEVLKARSPRGEPELSALPCVRHVVSHTSGPVNTTSSMISCTYNQVTSRMGNFRIVCVLPFCLTRCRNSRSNRSRRVRIRRQQTRHTKGREWVRTAFHDSFTHDATTKTGGMHASIQYELDRPDNLGAVLNNTLGDISSIVSTRSSAPDLLASSLVMSVARCADMRVPQRLGHKDAAEAGIKGVLEAHTDLNTTRKRFETAVSTRST
jgi:hypothetical protein